MDVILMPLSSMQSEQPIYALFEGTGTKVI